MSFVAMLFMDCSPVGSETAAVGGFPGTVRRGRLPVGLVFGCSGRRISGLQLERQGVVDEGPGETQGDLAGLILMQTVIDGMIGTTAVATGAVGARHDGRLQVEGEGVETLDPGQVVEGPLEAGLDGGRVGQGEVGTFGNAGPAGAAGPPSAGRGEHEDGEEPGTEKGPGEGRPVRRDSAAREMGAAGRRLQDQPALGSSTPEKK
jgi:hypothetical protein